MTSYLLRVLYTVTRPSVTCKDVLSSCSASSVDIIRPSPLYFLHNLTNPTMMMRVAFLTTVTAALAISGVSGLASSKNKDMSTGRRAFLGKIPASVATVAVGTTMGQFLNLEADDSDHRKACSCETCVGKSRLAFRPLSVSAFEARPVGGDNPGAVIASYNIQSVKTYDRLEKEGFKLDSREEEAARLSDALSSFSYPSTPTKNVKKDGKKSSSGSKS